MNKKMYRLYDDYEGYPNRVRIGEYDTLEEIRRAAQQWDEKTNGKCDFDIYQLMKDGKYHLRLAFTTEEICSMGRGEVQP